MRKTQGALFRHIRNQPRLYRPTSILPTLATRITIHLLSLAPIRIIRIHDPPGGDDSAGRRPKRRALVLPPVRRNLVCVAAVLVAVRHQQQLVVGRAGPRHDEGLRFARPERVAAVGDGQVDACAEAGAALGGVGCYAEGGGEGEDGGEEEEGGGEHGVWILARGGVESSRRGRVN
ncbi:hypothetical protein BDV95DRAFT_48864 [Massariosphaeria phaeospora]|uniref:Uncharacterized protein n=1 Tax=Massariosphaeria phaeospora TaxID=100035 RepID=A0A7C8IAZ4_9PLEO|nr:hypothetical protein BDV95DRAFT_48864 [Massariosphaeria phaeospora]